MKTFDFIVWVCLVMAIVIGVVSVAVDVIPLLILSLVFCGIGIIFDNIGK
jgi:hypothetical protein